MIASSILLVIWTGGLSFLTRKDDKKRRLEEGQVHRDEKVMSGEEAL